MRILGVIFAGGASKRMGQDKAFLEIAGKTLLEHCATALTPNCDDLIVSCRALENRIKAAGFKTLPDEASLPQTPVAGILTALKYAESEQFDLVVSAPCDQPFVSKEVFDILIKARPCFLQHQDQGHYLTACWPGLGAAALAERIKTGEIFSAQQMAQALGLKPKIVNGFSESQFININHREDLLEAMSIFANLSQSD